MDGIDEQLRLPLASSPLDRKGERRRDLPFLAKAQTDPTARLLLVADHHRIPVDAGGKLDWRPRAPGEDTGSETFLGVDDDGRPLFSRDARLDEIDDGFASLRDVGATLAEGDAAAAVEAVAISAWHRRAPHCPSCGGETVIEDAGHRRRCRACGTGHFPRSDPAVIMLVTDGSRCVLGRRAGAPSGRWSTLAGFVEVGESLEAAVAREVFEEVGLRVHATRYRGSQPWPFPASLMLAFEADADYGPLAINHEHLEVRWFSRDQVARGIASAEMTVPGPISAGGFLIRSWLGTGGQPTAAMGQPPA